MAYEHETKYQRAKELSRFGKTPLVFAEAWDRLPACVVAKLTSCELAMLVTAIIDYANKVND